MARKKKPLEHVNHERWLVSYADFITLLFAFFVVLFAVSQVDSRKVGRFTESFSRAIGIDLFPQPGKGLLAGAADGPTQDEDPTKSSPLPPELLDLKAALVATATRDDTLAGVQIVTKRNELVLRLSDNLLFDSGNDALDERARKVVGRLAAELQRRPVDIRVEGHTDDRPIKTARFRSNWDLSTARATTIVAALSAEGIAPERLSAAGYGEFHPIAPNTTDDGRKQNRRVDVVVMLQLPPEPEDAGAPATLGPPDAGHAGPARSR
jgi:chemotaxis protein MotB